MTSPEFSYRWCRQADLPVLQRFLADYWSPNHIFTHNTELLRWQHVVPDEPEGLSYYSAWDRATMVGVIGVIHVPFNLRGRTIRGGWLALWTVRPDYRQHSPGMQLMRDAMKSFDMAGAIGINPRVVPIYRAFGFRYWPAIPRWIRVIDRTAFQQLLEPANPKEKIAIAVATPPSPVNEAGESWEVCEATDELFLAWDAVWQAEFAPRLVGTARTAKHLTWRYRRHPVTRYRVVFFRNRNGDIDGLVVFNRLQVRDRAESVVRLVECLFRPGVDSAIGRKLGSLLSETGAAFAEYTEFNAPESLLAAAGFVPADELALKIPTRFQPLDFNYSDLNCALWLNPAAGLESMTTVESQRLYVTRGDSDQDRPN